MPFWIIWCVGLVITIILAVKIYNEDKINPIALHVLVIICIFIVGGIPDGAWCGWLFSTSEVGEDLIFNTICTILGMALTYVVGSLVLSFSKFKFKSVIFFFIVFLISVVFWSNVFYKYNSNVEEKTETIVLEESKRELLYFCNVPVREEPVNINESTSITTSGKLAYWYVSKEGTGVHDVAPASSSEMVYIDESETPYVEIKKCSTNTKEIDHNVNKESTIGEENIWYKYTFYLPEYILKYQLN